MGKKERQREEGKEKGSKREENREGRGREGKNEGIRNGAGNQVEKWEGGEGQQVSGNFIHP